MFHNWANKELRVIISIALGPLIKLVSPHLLQISSHSFIATSLLRPVSMSTYHFPLRIASHPPNLYNALTSSSPLIEPPKTKQSASRPPLPQLYTACRSSPPPSVQSIDLRVSTLNLEFPPLSWESRQVDGMKKDERTYKQYTSVHYV